MNSANAYVRPDNGLIECRACRTHIVRAARQKRVATLPETERRFRDGYPPEMICRTCGICKPQDDFGIRARVYKGVSYRNRSCKDCCYKRARNYRLKKLYGISAEDYDRLLVEQGDRCALCAASTDEADALVVDHEHASGRVRGLLCQPCNVAVGFFEVRIDIERMQAYLST